MIGAARPRRRRAAGRSPATRAIDSSSPEAGRPRRRPRGADRKRQRPDKLAIAAGQRVSGFRIPECRLPCAWNFVGKSGFTSNSGAAVSRPGCACVKRPNSGSRFPEVARSKNSANADAQVLDSGPQIPAQSPRAKPEFEVQTRMRASAFRRPNFRPERAIIAPYSAFPAAEIPAGISAFP